jgi:hypothetical protein
MSSTTTTMIEKRGPRQRVFAGAISMGSSPKPNQHVHPSQAPRNHRHLVAHVLSPHQISFQQFFDNGIFGKSNLCAARLTRQQLDICPMTFLVEPFLQDSWECGGERRSTNLTILSDNTAISVVYIVKRYDCRMIGSEQRRKIFTW